MMLVLYFSGTGNTAFLAERFAAKTGADCLSIEEEADFVKRIQVQDTLCFCYPIYGSTVPKIMRDFIKKYKWFLHKKKLIIFCTQHLFSGDGARVFTDLLVGIDYHVIYGEHFNMPNNICNAGMFKRAGAEDKERYRKQTEGKLDFICKDLAQGRIYKVGFNPLSQLTGFLSQRLWFEMGEKKLSRSVRVNSNCSACGDCVRICPMENFQLLSGKAVPKNKCTLCYRCVNRCPQKAITVMVSTPVAEQYRGIRT